LSQIANRPACRTSGSSPPDETWRTFVRWVCGSIHKHGSDRTVFISREKGPVLLISTS